MITRIITLGLCTLAGSFLGTWASITLWERNLRQPIVLTTNKATDTIFAPEDEHFTRKVEALIDAQKYMDEFRATPRRKPQ